MVKAVQEWQEACDDGEALQGRDEWSGSDDSSRNNISSLAQLVIKYHLSQVGVKVEARREREGGCALNLQ